MIKMETLKTSKLEWKGAGKKGNSNNLPLFLPNITLTKQNKKKEKSIKLK